MRRIRATKLDDLALISGYLHDSTFKHEEVALSDSRLTIGIDRPGYEFGRKRRALLVLPVATYPWVPAKIELTTVIELEWKWHQKREEVEDIPTNLLEIEGNPSEVRFHADYFVIIARLEVFRSLEVIDTGDPSPKGGISDLFSRLSNFGEAIDELRVDV